MTPIQRDEREDEVRLVAMPSAYGDFGADLNEALLVAEAWEDRNEDARAIVECLTRVQRTLDDLRESGITEEEAEAAALSINTRDRNRVVVDQLADQARAKLRAAFKESTRES